MYEGMGTVAVQALKYPFHRKARFEHPHAVLDILVIPSVPCLVAPQVVSRMSYFHAALHIWPSA